MSDRKVELRALVRDNVDQIMQSLNGVLRQNGLDAIEPVVQRVAGGQLPHWYAEFKERGTFANLDGKTIGSILEMLLVAVLEVGVLKDTGIKLRVNPARGVDLPDLDLGIKSPSENFCTSEPFFSAYERLYGNEHDCLVLLTDYQMAKLSKGEFRLQLKSWRYLEASQVADVELCRIAQENREWLLAEGESNAQRFFRFLAYVNQSDWRGRWLLRLSANLNSADFDHAQLAIDGDFARKNAAAAKKDAELIPESDLRSLQKIFTVTPRWVGLLNELDNWVAEFLKDAARAPNQNEWERLRNGPLNGVIGMSFALQWRYNFGRLFPRSLLEAQAIKALDAMDTGFPLPVGVVTPEVVRRRRGKLHR